MIIAKNKANGVESKFTQEQWNNLPPKTKAIFNVKSVPTPKEVLELEKKKAAQVKEAETPQKETQKVEDAKKPTTRKKAVKTKENNTGNQK